MWLADKNVFFLVSSKTASTAFAQQSLLLPSVASTGRLTPENEAIYSIFDP